MRYGKFVLCLSLLVIPTLGCAFGTDYIKASYVAETPKEKPGRGEVIYVAKAADNRPITGLVGQKRNTYGMKTGQIALEKDLNLSTIVTSAIADSLSTYGYTVKQAEELKEPLAGQGETEKVLYTSIKDFWVDFSPGFFSVDANSNVALDFELKVNGTDRVIWKNTTAQKSKASSIWGATTGLFEESLNRAFKNSMEDFQHLISSADFKNALIEK